MNQEPVAVVEGLRYRYPGGHTDTLQDISFAVAAGSVLGLLGPSGAGKSTTIKALLGMLSGYGGSVRVLGHEMERPPRAVYRAIGVAFETPRLYAQLTALENLRFFADLIGADRTKAMPLLERFGLGAHANERAGTFSKGMRVRLGVARAFLGQPRLLFLDEPTSGLDPNNAAIVKEAIREARGAGAAILLTTHDMQVADELADTVAFLVEGRIVAAAPPRELKLRFGERTLRAEVRRDDGLVTEVFELDSLDRNEAFARLLANPRAIETLHSNETTLGDVFMRLTGRRLL